MSLNRCEQQLFDYMQRNRDERHYWEAKVRSLAASADTAAATQAIEAELWQYLKERAEVIAEFREYRGGKRLSLRNLAEYLQRLWIAPKPKPTLRARLDF
jgi:hypothetical protein